VSLQINQYSSQDDQKEKEAMKRLKPMLIRAGIVAAFVLLTSGLGPLEGAAQQMGDMPMTCTS
jgi:hypothetical protein